MIDTFRHKGLRKQLVELLREKGIRDERILEAIGKIPRHIFMDSGFIEFSYKDKAFLSQHIGDLDNFASYEHYCATVDHLEQLFRIEPEIAAYDLHPDYLSTRYAKAFAGSSLVAVQHHHAHIAACLAENKAGGPVIGLALSPDERWIASSTQASISIWPMPDVTQPPLHTLSHEELMAKLRALTNLEVVADEAASTGYRVEVGPFPGWEQVPAW